MNMNTVDDDISNELNGNAGPISNVHVGPASINRLKAVHDELLLQGDHHVSLEHYPQGSVLDDGMAECARPWVDWVVITWVAHYVVLAVTTADSVAPKANGTVSQVFPT